MKCIMFKVNREIDSALIKGAYSREGNVLKHLESFWYGGQLFVSWNNVEKFHYYFVTY